MAVGLSWAGLRTVDRHSMQKANDLKVAFPRQESPLNYDPANIQMAYEYILLETIYSPLIEYDQSGRFKPGLAEKFWWENGKLKLLIRRGTRTADGDEINAEDVAFSLKRVMLLGANTHGNLADLICHGRPLKSVEQPCPGLEVHGDLVVLSPPEPNPFLISMLTGIDFAVIPRRAVDPKTLQIREMRNTSGPMYVEQISSNEVVLRRNPSHYNFDLSRPDSIHLVPSVKPGHMNSKALDLFTQGKIDLVTTIDSTSAEEVVDYHLKHPSTTVLHSSLDIRIFMLRFSKSALEKVGEAERFSLGPALVQSIRKEFEAAKTLKITEQIVPAYGEGSLSDDQLRAIAGKVNSRTLFDKQKPWRVYLMRLPNVHRFKNAVKVILPNAQFFDSNERTLPNWGDDDVDLMISGPDMGYVEDIALYSYALKAGILRASGGADRWLSQYMSTELKEDRIRLIQDLHRQNLEGGWAFPIFASPYVAMARKPWEITIPKMFANHPLWQTSYPR